MDFLRRGIISVSRNFGKAMILLVLIFGLGSLISGAISTQRAVINMDMNLRRNMRPIVNLEFDVMAFVTQTEDAWNDSPEIVSVDMIRYIANLPYVSHYNYSIQAVLDSFTFQPYVPTMIGHEIVDWRIGTDMENWPDFINITGVSRAEIIYLEQGSSEIVAGRTFTETEMVRSTYFEVIPIVMSRPQAYANELFLGSTFTWISRIPYTDSNGRAINWEEDELFAKREYTFKIVGLFDRLDRRMDLVADIAEDEAEFRQQSVELNHLYIPSWAAEEIARFSFETNREMINETGITPPLGFDPDAEFQIRAESIFVLENPLDMDAFREIVEPLIPEYYHVRDLSGTFAGISASMETLLWIADLVLIMAIIATILVLSLVLMLFLRDRRYEIGIYLALGEKKLKIVAQIIFEVVAIAFVGIILALFSGSAGAAQLSQMLMRSELMREVEPQPSTGIYGIAGYFESLRLTQEMSIDDMMMTFDVSLDEQTVMIFYVVGMVTVIIATLVPVMYIIRLKPKEILMKN